MYVLENHPLEEPGSVPSRTTQGLTNVIEAALRKSGSETHHLFSSPSTAFSVWSHAWSRIDLMTLEGRLDTAAQTLSYISSPAWDAEALFSENTPGFFHGREDNAMKSVERLFDEEREGRKASN